MKKLLVVVGAGASLDFGMPSVKEVDKCFQTWAKKVAPLVEDNNKSLYDWVKEKLVNYSSRNSKIRMDSLINFESVLFTLQNLASIYDGDHWNGSNHRLRPFIELDNLPVIDGHRGTKTADGFDLHHLQSRLTDDLLSLFRKKCSALNKNRFVELNKLRSFFEALRGEFKISFINLNYDNVILSTLPDLETGFNTESGLFERQRLFNSDWNFCYHVHGSVHFDMVGGDGVEMHKILWNSDLTSNFRGNSSGRNSNYTSEGLGHLNSSIITGLDKANQLMREPFGSYFMRLDQVIYESDALLFMGYGFADAHLNKTLPFVRYDSHKKRKVAIIDWASDEEDGLNHRHDSWTHGVFQAIPYNSFEMGDGMSRIPKPVVHYKNERTLEKSSNPQYPLAIWYNGVSEACEYPDRIIKELI